MKKTKIIVIVGPTASGKTKLSIELAKKYKTEIISADSMQIYKHMDIATAKPTVEEMDGVTHHLLDFLEIDSTFSVSEYVNLANVKINELTAKKKLPIIVGGTGLYIDSLINNIQFTEQKTDFALREELYTQYKQDNGKSLYDFLCKIDPQSAANIHQNNMIRVVRAVEVFKTTGITMTQHNENSKKVESPFEACIIGLNYNNRQDLYDRINLRVDIMLENGLLEEAKKVFALDKKGTAFNAIGYKELQPYFNQTDTLENCIDKIKQESRRYAKRQLTWFRKNDKINWVMLDKNTDFNDVFNCSENIIDSFLVL